MRDINQWAGGFDVSSKGFSAALERVGQVILVPGGQAEMVDSSSRATAVRVSTSHKGFVRKALLHGATLVPW